MRALRNGCKGSTKYRLIWFEKSAKLVYDGINLIKNERCMKTVVAVSGVLFLTACSTTQAPKTPANAITPPTIVKSPDLTNLPTKSCKNGETIITPATLKLNKQGKVVDVFGLTVKDKQLASQIIAQFKQAQYTPYLQAGTPIAKDLPIVIRLKCPKNR